MDERPRDPRPVDEPAVSRPEQERYATEPPPRVSPVGRPASPMWIWIFPLVIVVLVLAWFIFTSGEPRSPLSGTRQESLEPRSQPAPGATTERAVTAPTAPESAPAAAPSAATTSPRTETAQSPPDPPAAADEPAAASPDG